MMDDSPTRVAWPPRVIPSRAKAKCRKRMSKLQKMWVFVFVRSSFPGKAMRMCVGTVGRARAPRSQLVSGSDGDHRDRANQGCGWEDGRVTTCVTDA